MPWLEAWLHPADDTAVAQNQLVPVAPIEPTYEERKITLKSGQQFTAALQANGITADDTAQIVDAVSDVFNIRKLKSGQDVNLSLMHDENGTNLQALNFIPDSSQKIEVVINSDQEFEAHRIARLIEKRVIAVVGEVKGSFNTAARQAGMPRSIVNNFTKVMSYDMDLQRDLHAGDDFNAMFEAFVDEDGQIVRTGDLLYASLQGKSAQNNIYKYNDNYYHADGRNIRKALLKTPVDGARMSSGFGFRMHPVLGYSAMHKGVDFAAPEGTPIYAAGNGIIEKAAIFSSFGNYVLIKHNNTFETAYAHLSRYGKGIHPGVKVAQGQIIGYVGQTGRATGTHLHFEVHQGGVQVNPTKVASFGDDRLLGVDLKKFQTALNQQRQTFASLMNKAPTAVAQNTKGPTAIR